MKKARGRIYVVFLLLFSIVGCREKAVKNTPDKTSQYGSFAPEDSLSYDGKYLARQNVEKIAEQNEYVNDIRSDIIEQESARNKYETDEVLLSDIQSWQEAYADLLQESLGKDFYLYDIDGDRIPELLTGGSIIEAGKHAKYNLYTYKDSLVECLGEVVTLSWSSLWIDNSGGILGYSYGAGGGGTYRYYIDNGVLCYDGEIYGYLFDSEGNSTDWFRDPDGNKIIVTDETEDVFESIWKNRVEMQRYEITESNIVKLIYGWEKHMMNKWRNHGWISRQ